MPSSPNPDDSQQPRRSFNWRSPQFVALAAAVAVAAIAVPAWAKSDHGLDDELTPAPGGVTPRAGGPVPPPPGGVAAVLPAGVPAGAAGRDESVAPPPPPPGEAPQGLPPHPPAGNPFPLSDEEIEHQRELLQDFVDCLRDHGQEVGDPEVGPFKILLPADPDEVDPFSDEFQAASAACGGLPLPGGEEAPVPPSGEPDSP